jgi:hypothetical protein
MRPKRTIEPQSEVFAQRLRDRHLISPAGSDFARALLAKYAGFNRARSDFPALIYFELTAAGDRGVIEQKGIEFTPQEARGQSARVNVATAPPVVMPARKMIQRRSLSGGSPAGGFATREPGPVLRSPGLREAPPFEQSLAPVSLSGASRVSASLSRFRDTSPADPTATATRVLFLPAAPSESRRRTATSPRSDGPNPIPSIGLPAESREGSPPLVLSHRPAAAIRSDAGEDQVRKLTSGRPGPPLPPIFAAIRVSAPKLMGSQSEGAIGFAGFRSPILSEVDPSRPEAFTPEILRRDIRMNLLVRGLPRNTQTASAASLSMPSLDLTLPTTRVPEAAASAVAPTPGRSPAEDQEVTVRSMNDDTRPAVERPVLSVPEVADKVYRLLERRLMIERERRGVFRT